LHNPDLVKRLADLGGTAATSSPAEFKALLQQDRAK